jgi:hypothetical protein
MSTARRRKDRRKKPRSHPLRRHQIKRTSSPFFSRGCIVEKAMAHFQKSKRRAAHRR